MIIACFVSPQQGFAFFLFYVVLNPQFRQFILVVWTWKESMVTPFDDHEAIEIEEDKVNDLCIQGLGSSRK